MALSTVAAGVVPDTVSGGLNRAPTVLGGLNGFLGFRILMPQK